MNTAQVFRTIFPVFTLMAAGYCFGKFKKIDLSALTDIVIYLGAPCLVFGSVSQRRFAGTDFLLLGGAAAFVSLLHFSLGVYLVTFQRSLGPILRFPILYAFAAALVVSIGKIQIPAVVMVPINMMGSLSITMMVFALGYKISGLKARSVGLPVLASTLRIGGGFLLGMLFVEIFGVTGLNRAIILLVSTMPSAVFNFVLAEKYRLSPELVASTILISTLASLITIPAVLAYLLS